MSFSDQPPSKQWAALKYRGEKFAEVWFQPDGEPSVIAFRLCGEGLQLPGIREQLTVENLLKAVAIAPEEVESWCLGDASHLGRSGTNPDLTKPLSLSEHGADLEIRVRLHSPSAVAPRESDTPQTAAPELRHLEAVWKVILGMEAALDTSRLSAEGISRQIEALTKRALSMEEKTYALRADVAQWNAAKKRAQFALPKLKDFIHRAVWALGSPEKKRLEELYKNHIQPGIALPQMDEVLKRLEELQKDRQVLSALGKAVYQESRGVATEIEASYRTLHNNALDTQRKKNASGGTGRLFKK